MNIFENCENTKHQGNIGVSLAITKLTQKGYPILLPFGETKDYDLAFDDNDGLKKVQVRTTTEKNKNKVGGYRVHLRVLGGNRSFHTAKLFEKKKIDWLFVITGDGTTYFIPSNEINATTYLVLNQNMDKFKI